METISISFFEYLHYHDIDDSGEWRCIDHKKRWLS